MIFQEMSKTRIESGTMVLQQKIGYIFGYAILVDVTDTIELQMTLM